MSDFDRTGVQPRLRAGVVTKISDTTTASAEDAAEKVNEVIDELRKAGILGSE